MVRYTPKFFRATLLLVAISTPFCLTGCNKGNGGDGGAPVAIAQPDPFGGVPFDPQPAGGVVCVPPNQGFPPIVDQGFPPDGLPPAPPKPPGGPEFGGPGRPAPGGPEFGGPTRPAPAGPEFAGPVRPAVPPPGGRPGPLGTPVSESNFSLARNTPRSTNPLSSPARPPDALGILDTSSDR